VTEAEILEIARDGIVVMIKIGAPIMVLALVVGLVISLIQALTQIQETTLSFVPKLLVIFGAMVLFLPFMLTTLSEFTQQLMDRIASPL
jgi:flagellar biosynthetic protein FliQ